MTFLTIPLVLLGQSFAVETFNDPGFTKLGDTSYHADSYSLKVKYTPDTSVLEGDMTMKATLKKPAAFMALDLRGFTVSKVMLNGKPANFKRFEEKLFVLFPTASKGNESVTVETVYSGVPQPASTSALPSMFKIGWVKWKDGAIAACEPDGAHAWFPCNDHPRDKATFDLSVEVPKGWDIVSGGKELTKTDTTASFSIEHPVMTAMDFVAIGHFEKQSVDGPSGIPISNYFEPAEHDKAVEKVSVVPKYLAYLTGKFGAYPYDTYGNLLLPQAAASEPILHFAALETTTLPFYGPGVDNHADMMHEMTHQWFGDCVSVTNWAKDIWWVEGMAQYSEWMCTELEKGPEAYRKQVMNVYGQVKARGKWLQPGLVTAPEMFGERSYVAGALTFAALRQKVGDDQFFKICKAFIARNRYGNASVEDWKAVAKEINGKSFDEFFDTWLTSPTTPPLDLLTPTPNSLACG